MILPSVALSLLAGLRGVEVGTDTIYYYSMFEHMLEGHGGYFDSEPIFGLIAKISLLLFDAPQAAFIVVAFLTNGLIIYRLWTMRGSYSFSWAMAVYITLIYPQCFNVMRQWLALSIVFFATVYLKDRKAWRFFLLAIVATLVHNSAVVSLLFLLIYCHLKVRGKYERVLIYLLMVIMAFVGIWVAASFLLERYAYFFTSRFQISVSYIYLLKVGLFILYVVFANKMTGSCEPKDDSRRTIGAAPSIGLVELGYGLGLAVSSAGLLFDQLARVGAYFTVLEMLFIAKASNDNYLSILFRLSYSLIMFYNFIIGIALQGLYGITPYSLCLL